MSGSAPEAAALLSDSVLAQGLPMRPHGVLGPNAIIQMAGVLRDRLGPIGSFDVFERAGIDHYLALPPDHMVDEREVAALHAALHEAFGALVAGQLAFEAGLRTGSYLLEHRIPHTVTAALRWLPKGNAIHILSRAIARHAWTFVGGGTFSVRAGVPLVLEVRGSPLCRLIQSPTPVCDYFAGTFQRLFAAVAGTRVTVRETACEAAGDEACRFEVSWARPRATASGPASH